MAASRKNKGSQLEKESQKIMPRSTQSRANANRSQDFIENKKVLESAMQSRLDIFQPKPMEESGFLEQDLSIE